MWLHKLYVIISRLHVHNMHVDFTYTRNVPKTLRKINNKKKYRLIGKVCNPECLLLKGEKNPLIKHVIFEHVGTVHSPVHLLIA